MAVADLPPTSGAHWANRDNDVQFHRPGGTPFRPSPETSGPGDTTPPTTPDATAWDAFVPSGPSGFEAAWDAFGAATAPKETPVTHGPADPEPMLADRQHWTGRDVSPLPRAEPPEFGPAPPAGPGRVSFGVTDGPIGGPRNTDGPIARPRRMAALLDSITPFSPAVLSSPAAPHESIVLFSPAVAFSPAAPFSPADAGRIVPDPAAPEDITHTGELFLGPGREIRPHRAARRDPGLLPPVQDPPPMRGANLPPSMRGADLPPSMRGAGVPPPRPRRSRTMIVTTAVLGTLVLLGGAVAAVPYVSGRDRSLTSILALAAGDTPVRSVSAPIAGRVAASFELVAATTQLRMRAADLGDDLYRVTTADDSGSAPRAVVTGNRVQLQLTPDGDGASGIVEVLLSSRVTWALRFVGGGDEQIVNLAGGRVSSIDVIGGSRRVELALPRPTGTVPVRIAGALDELTVTAPKGAPVRVQVDSGARAVTAGARTLRDVRPGSTLTPKNWRVPNRYDVDAASWITTLSVANLSG